MRLVALESKTFKHRVVGGFAGGLPHAATIYP
jgi:hypothetical protein